MIVWAALLLFITIFFIFPITVIVLLSWHWLSKMGKACDKNHPDHRKLVPMLIGSALGLYMARKK